METATPIQDKPHDDDDDDVNYQNVVSLLDHYVLITLSSCFYLRVKLGIA